MALTLPGEVADRIHQSRLRLAEELGVGFEELLERLDRARGTVDRSSTSGSTTLDPGILFSASQQFVLLAADWSGPEPEVVFLGAVADRAAAREHAQAVLARWPGLTVRVVPRFTLDQLVQDPAEDQAGRVVGIRRALDREILQRTIVGPELLLERLVQNVVRKGGQGSNPRFQGKVYNWRQIVGTAIPGEDQKLLGQRFRVSDGASGWPTGELASGARLAGQAYAAFAMLEDPARPSEPVLLWFRNLADLSSREVDAWLAQVSPMVAPLQIFVVPLWEPGPLLGFRGDGPAAPAPAPSAPAPAEAAPVASEQGSERRPGAGVLPLAQLRSAPTPRVEISNSRVYDVAFDKPAGMTTEEWFRSRRSSPAGPGAAVGSR